MKKFLFCFCIVMIMFSASVFATNVQLNGEIIDFTDSNGNKVDAQIINNRTMVPLRKIFELLGCKVDWEANTQKITATRDNKKIVLQINNKIAEKSVDGVTTTITLDSAPVIVNDRTLVPLRFIAESLGKQVGWDGANGTAIIIDYTYFENALKNKCPALFYFLKDDYDTSKDANVVIKRKYTDKIDNSYSNTAIVTAKISENKSMGYNQNIELVFSGNNPLMQDIVKEQWNNSKLNATFTKDEYNYTTSGVLAKMISSSGTDKYSSLNISGTGLSELEDAFRNLIEINENKINIYTFGEVRQEFNKLCDLFNTNNTVEETEWGTKYSWNFSTVALKYSNSNLKYFDLTKLDNIIFDNTYSRAYSLINRKVFNYDVKLDELLYDNTYMNLSGRISSFVKNDKIVGTNADITYNAYNDYDEAYEYNVTINW